MTFSDATRVLPLALLLIPAVASAKPATHGNKAKTSANSPKKPQTVPMKKGANTSATLPKKQHQTVPMNTEANASANPIRKVQPMPKATLDKLKRAKPLSKRAKRQLLEKAGMVIKPSDIGEATTVSVRRPWLNGATHLSFTGLNMVYPASRNGIAIVGQSGGRDDYDDAPRPSPEGTDAQEADQPFRIDPCSFGPICPRNLPGNRPAPRAPRRGPSYATLRFKAAKDKAYVVDCLASGSATLHGDVIVDKAIADSDSGTADGHFDLLVSRGERRHVRVDLWSEGSFTLRQCTITPVS